MIMLTPWNIPGPPTALVVAALTAGIALFCPFAIRGPHWPRRAELSLVVFLLLAGLAVSANLLAGAVSDKGSPMWVALVSVYAVLGVAGALPSARRPGQVNWAFPIFLVAQAVMTVAFLRATPAFIDVQIFLHDGAVALLHGQNPYSMTFPNMYHSPYTELFYGPGVVANGRITYGFPYMPVALLVAIPGQLLGDVRYSQLVAMLATAFVLRRLARDGIGRAAALLAVVAPWTISMLTGSWTEPTLVALLACFVFALERQRHALVAVFLGLFLASKQYVVVTIPIIWLVYKWVTRRTLFVSFGLAAAVTLPFFLFNPAAFWKAIVEFQFVQPFRSDSVSLLVSSVKAFGWPPPWTYGVLPLAGGGLTAIALALRAPRTPSAFSASVGLTLLVTILLSKQAFMNYYFLVNGAFLIAVVAWPSPPSPSPPLPTTTRSAEVGLDAQP